MPDHTPHPDDAPQIARRLLIHGRVQGVRYRAGAQAEATRLGLAGWVRNRADGSVEALAIGPPAQVEAFAAWARRGPPKAQVLRVDVVEAEVEALATFAQRPTL